MKVAEIIPSLRWGGAEHFTLQLSEALLKGNFVDDLWLISLSDAIEEDLMRKAKQNGCQVIVLKKTKGIDWSLIYRLYKVIRAIKPDVVHTHLEGLFYCLVPCFLLSIKKKIYTIHSLPEKNSSALMRWVYVIAFNLLGWTAVALSRRLKDQTDKYLFTSARVIENGIKEEMISETKQELRCRFGKEFCLETSSKIMLSVGALRREKNHKLLVAAFSKVAQRIPVYLLIVGDVGESNFVFTELNRYIKDNLSFSAAERILFLGARGDVSRLMKCADVFVISSVYEGLPLVLLEAMAYQAPIVSTNVGAIPEVLDNHSALLVESNEAISLAAAINRVLLDEKLSDKLTSNARKLFDRFCKISICAKKYRNLFYSRYANTSYSRIVQ